MPIEPVAQFDPNDELIDYEEDEEMDEDTNSDIVADSKSKTQAEASSQVSHQPNTEVYTKLAAFKIPKQKPKPVRLDPPVLQDQQARSAMMLDEASNPPSSQGSRVHPQQPLKNQHRNLTVEERDLLSLHRANLEVWKQAQKKKDFKAFKKATIKGKAYYRQLLNMLGYEHLMERSENWNPTDWDWTTFEKRKRGKKFAPSNPSNRQNQPYDQHKSAASSEMVELIKAAGIAVMNARGLSSR